MADDSAVPRRPRRRMSRTERRSQLLDVAERLFIEQGYATVTIEEIARVAGVSRPIVYGHFECKEGVLVACVARAYEAYNATLASMVDSRDTLAQQLRTGGELFFTGLQVDSGRWMLVFMSPSVVTGTYADDLARLRLQHIEAIRAVLARSLPDAPPERVEAGAHVVSGVGERLAFWWFGRPDLTRETLVDHYVDLLLNGLGPLAATGSGPASADAG